MPVKEIKIGLDFHGVINDRPEYFAFFSQVAFSRGYEIHVITGGPYDVVKKILDHWGFRYTRIFAILDFYDAKGYVSYFDNGEYRVPDKLWDTAKAEYCALNGINIHIDDSSVYARWFTTPYCHYSKVENNCTSPSQITIDFSQPPEKAVNEVEQLVAGMQFY